MVFSSFICMPFFH